MFPSSALKPALVCIVVTLLSACSTSPENEDARAEDTLTASAIAIDEPTARANALDEGQAQCLARGGRDASLVNTQITPPAMPTVDDDPEASSSTDALEAATSEGDAWRVTLTLRCR